MSVQRDQAAIERTISDFLGYVNELSKKINSDGCLWNDSKYFELRDSVSRIAAESKEIIRESDRLRSAIKSFISSEDW